ncbi:DUF3788 family protein [Chryseobacterium sp. CT-SW4]|uniref:DUF3788 family protein n=1 Tax=Chryseobacterium sp. SW-1 TaxID=3157343 RepID=UPI003B01CC66
MTQNNAGLLLRDPDLKPSDALFSSILPNPLYHILQEVQKHIEQTGLMLEWRFYKDGKAWLGKAVHQKKTVFWLSLWEDCIKTSFYFTEKTRPGVFMLNISQNLISGFRLAAPSGKLISLIIDLREDKDLQDFKTVMSYKKV